MGRRNVVALMTDETTKPTTRLGDLVRERVERSKAERDAKAREVFRLLQPEDAKKKEEGDHA